MNPTQYKNCFECSGFTFLNNLDRVRIIRHGARPGKSTNIHGGHGRGERRGHYGRKRARHLPDAQGAGAEPARPHGQQSDTESLIIVL